MATYNRKAERRASVEKLVKTPKSGRDRGTNYPSEFISEKIKWHRAIRVWWVLKSMGVHLSTRQRTFIYIKDRRSTLPKHSAANSWS